MEVSSQFPISHRHCLPDPGPLAAGWGHWGGYGACYPGYDNYGYGYGPGYGYGQYGGYDYGYGYGGYDYGYTGECAVAL